jgi:hypothetical protein
MMAIMRILGVLDFGNLTVINIVLSFSAQMKAGKNSPPHYIRREPVDLDCLVCIRLKVN